MFLQVSVTLNYIYNQSRSGDPGNPIRSGKGGSDRIGLQPDRRHPYNTIIIAIVIAIITYIVNIVTIILY